MIYESVVVRRLTEPDFHVEIAVEITKVDAASEIHTGPISSRDTAIRSAEVAIPTTTGANLRLLMACRASNRHVTAIERGRRVGSHMTNGSDGSPLAPAKLIRQIGHFGSAARPHETTPETGCQDVRQSMRAPQE
jgi:hypothetical protein